MTASLDLPQWINSVYPVRCIRPAHRRGDHVVVRETTYLDASEDALQNPDVQSGFIEQSYRPGLNEVLVDDYYESLARGQLRSLYFTIKMIDSRRSRVARRLDRYITENRDALMTVISGSVEAAVTVISHLHGVPVGAELATGILGKAGRPIFEKVCAVLRAVHWRHCAAVVGDRPHCCGRSQVLLHSSFHRSRVYLGIDRVRAALHQA